MDHMSWLVHQSLAGVASSYLADDCTLLADNCFHTRMQSRTAAEDDCRLLSDLCRRTLRSSATDFRTLGVPWTHNKFSDRSFSTAGPRQWNDLPPGLRRPDLSFPVFRQKLKTFVQPQRLMTSRFFMRYINALYVCMYVCMSRSQDTGIRTNAVGLLSAYVSFLLLERQWTV